MISVCSLVLVIERVNALVDCERHESGTIGGSDRTSGENAPERGTDLGQGLVRGESPRVRLAAESRRHVRQLVRNTAALEVTSHRGVEQGAGLARERRDGGERYNRLFGGIELLGQDTDPRGLAAAVDVAT